MTVKDSRGQCIEVVHLAALPVVGRDGAVISALDTPGLARPASPEESSAGVAGHGSIVEVGGGRGSTDPAGVLRGSEL